MEEFSCVSELIDESCFRGSHGQSLEKTPTQQITDDSRPSGHSAKTQNSTETHTQGCADEDGILQSFVIVYNVAKRHNIGTLARSATAFGVSEMILVGKRKDINAFGSHGAAAHIQYRHFFTLGDARSYLKKNGCDIVGVEITDSAVPVHSHPFTRSSAFLLGNEGTGLSEKEMAICDYFVYISQYGGGTASLNVCVAASIVLHHFAVWAGFSERSRNGNKFQVADRPYKQKQHVICSTPESVAEMRRLKKNAYEDFLSNGGQYDVSLSCGQIVESPDQDTSSALTKLFQDLY